MAVGSQAGKWYCAHKLTCRRCSKHSAFRTGSRAVGLCLRDVRELCMVRMGGCFKVSSCA